MPLGVFRMWKTSMHNGLDSENRIWREAQKLLTSHLTLVQKLQGIAEVVVGQFLVDSCAIYLLEGHSDELVIQACIGQTGSPKGRLHMGQGITGLAAAEKKTIQVVKMSADPRAVLLENQEGAYQSIVAVPLVEGDRIHGVFNLQSTSERQFSTDEIEVLDQVVKPVILNQFTRAQSAEIKQRRTNELRVLNELGQGINSGLGLDETLELIADQAIETVQANAVVIRFVAEDGALALGTVAVKSGIELDLQSEKKFAQYVADFGEPILSDCMRMKWGPGSFGISLVCIPLVLNDRVVGTVTLFDKIVPAGAVKRPFDVDDLNLLFAISSQVATKIEEFRLTNQLGESVRNEKRQEAELGKLYSHSQALFESISDGLVALDSRGFISEVNAIAKGIFGFERLIPGEIKIDELVEDKPSLTERLGSGEGFSHREVRLTTTSGQVAALANFQPIVDAEDKVSGAVMTFREMGEVSSMGNGGLGVRRTFSFADLIGKSSLIQKTRELARIAAGTDSNILIQGETGTGKEVFAQAIHNASRFSKGPFLAVNCAALPWDLIESELFGYVGGAFTGARTKGSLGKFELARGGTLFLDEIGEIPLDVQVKLLRVLQERAIVRVGGDRTIPIDCRLVAATNRDLSQAVQEQKFRRDLLYRLNVITVEVPPLRERKEDIPLFIGQFLKSWAAKSSNVVQDVSNSVLAVLLEYEWPGNVRELENVIEHSIAMARGPLIEKENLPVHMQATGVRVDKTLKVEVNLFEKAQEDYENSVRRLYLEALRLGQGDVPKAAQILGVSRATFYRKIKKAGLSPPSQK